jgi:hypothetical protein
LENDGLGNTRASHLEKILFGNELMVPETPLISSLSKFSLSLFKDSGFFLVDVDQAEEFFWGKNAGCNFVSFFCDGLGFYKNNLKWTHQEGKIMILEPCSK